MRRTLHATILGAVLFALPLHGQSPRSVDTSLKLYLFDGGLMKERDGVPYGLSLEQVPPRDLADLCALVVHPGGTLLWDTGLNESVNDTPPGEVRPGRPRAGDRVGKSLKKQLAEIGYTPADIKYLALSHGHWDHVGNVKDYLGSTWLVQKAERDSMFPEGRSPAADVAGLKDARTEVVDGDHDVFGDGKVVLIATPGHTPGHQALFVSLPNTGAVVLSGDLYHFPEELTLKPTPTGRNGEQNVASMQKLQALIARTRAQLWIQHDILGFRTLKKSPAYYD